jgi:GR25 family glycosyltransferase involved in LPS biosynthesis
MENFIPIDFSIEFYKIFNIDLKNFSDEDLIKHYIEYGKKENRKYKFIVPLNFNSLIYKNLNSDLEHLNEENLVKHYFLHGVKEKRKYLTDDYIDFKKINFIDKILWINLERAHFRKNNIENNLKFIDITNFRIDAIDGKNNIEKYFSQKIDYERNLSSYEIACTLSHIKAINHLKNENGEYFMICEDDISFENLKYFKNDLKNIITNCPEFDILLLNKTYDTELDNLYNKWNDYYNLEDKHISSAVCYIITKKGVEKITKKMKYFIENDIFSFENIKLDVSDILLYKNVNTYVYKYNFISYESSDSYIHNDHLYTHIENKIRELNYILRDNLV